MAIRLPLFQFSYRRSQDPFSFLQKITLLCALQWALFSSYPLPAFVCCFCIALLTYVYIPGSLQHAGKALAAFSPIFGISAVFLFLSDQVSYIAALLYLARLFTSLVSGIVLFVSTSHYDYMAAMRRLARYPVLRGLSFVFSFVFMFLLHVGESYATVHDALYLKGIRPIRNPIRYARYVSLGIMLDQFRYVEVLYDALVLKHFAMNKWQSHSEQSRSLYLILTILFTIALITYPTVWEFISP